MRKTLLAVLLLAALATNLQIRIDATNVLNHPTPGIPSFAANTFGQITTKTGERSLQGQLRVVF
jgi:hypothetical protein